jgi:hypothetical protein
LRKYWSLHEKYINSSNANLVLERTHENNDVSGQAKPKRYEIYHYYKSHVVEDRDKSLLTNGK